MPDTFPNKRRTHDCLGFGSVLNGWVLFVNGNQDTRGMMEDSPMHSVGTMLREKFLRRGEAILKHSAH